MNYYDFALKDLRSSKALLNHSCEYDIVVLKCQQYLEKALKYLILLKNGEIYKSHEVTVLANYLKLEGLCEYDYLLKSVNDFYITKSYPSLNYIETSKDEAEIIFNETLQVKEILEKYIEQFKNVPLYNKGVFDSFR